MDILIIEDEVKVARLIKKILEEQGYTAEIAYDGLIGKRMALQRDFDLIIMDLNLPGINGIELCKLLRQAKLTLPILMLTALNATEDIVEGLDAGANDYMTKPFKLEELLARIRALGRIRLATAEHTIYQAADLILNVDTREVTRNGQLIELTATEFSLLELLLRSKGRVLSKAYIAESIWGNDHDVESNLIEVYISFLRNKIDKHFNPKLISTKVGMGYVIKQV